MREISLISHKGLTRRGVDQVWWESRDVRSLHKSFMKDLTGVELISVVGVSDVR